MRHVFARVHAAHAEQRKNANENEATQDSHEKNDARLMLVMIAHTKAANAHANAPTLLVARFDDRAWHTGPEIPRLSN
jgi:hypothetical protein